MDEAEAAVLGKTFEDYQRIRKLIEATNKENPKAADVKALRAELASNPMLWRFAGNTARLASETIISRLDASALVKESTLRGMEEMRAELGYEAAPHLERLVIEQVVLCWVRLHITEIQHCQFTSGEHTLTSGIYWDKRLTNAQRRFMRASESLAKVRKLASAAKLAEARANATNKTKAANNIRRLKAVTA
jgi:hypothetical protein